MNQRDKMVYLLGQLQSIGYPLQQGEMNHAYYDLIDSIIMQYKNILMAIYPDFNAE
jgi:hypothetical protein